MIDLIVQLGIPVILVSRNYLGSINHTILSIEALQRREIPIAGIVMNGEPNLSTEAFIESKSALPVLFRVKHFDEISKSEIHRFTQTLKCLF
jgi:dethiobiotin synthetase